jgi:hypothetical protein
MSHGGNGVWDFNKQEKIMMQQKDPLSKQRGTPCARVAWIPGLDAVQLTSNMLSLPIR